jgi:phage/plasmid-like protein (TIGR03299 family)
VTEAPTPTDALRLAGLDWEVEQKPIQLVTGEPITTHQANIRSTDGAQLGIVGKDWTPIQNATLANLAEQLNQDGIVRVESAGSLDNGRRVWFLLKGESVFVKRESDKIVPYILLANGHDGSLALTAQTTTVRVECNNKLNIALNQSNQRRIKFNHTKNIVLAPGEIRAALGAFEASVNSFQSQAEALAATELNRQSLDAFFLDVYTKVLGLKIPTIEERNKGEGQRAYNNAVERLSTWKHNFQVEVDQRGTTPSAWAAFNAITEEFREREESEVSALFDGGAKRRQDTFKAALALVG